METTQHQIMFDPGLDWGMDVERASMVIGNAHRWREHAVDHGSVGWRVLRAYGPTKHALARMSPEELWERLTTDVQPSLRFMTARPDWATETITGEVTADGLDACTHERTFLVRPQVRLVLSVTDTLTPEGVVKHGQPACVLDVEGDDGGWVRTSMNPALLRHLSASAEEASKVLANVWTAFFGGL